MEYDDWLKSKKVTDPCTGLTEIPELNPMLFDFQKDIVTWALKRGRACIFADCGMGKTPMQLEWCTRSENEIHKHSILGVKSNMLGKFGKLHPRIKKVNQYDIVSGILLNTFYGASEASRSVNGSQPNISACCRGRKLSAYGFSWRFADV